MSMILFVSAALADRILWTTEPDPVSSAAVARTVPGATSARLDSLVTGGTLTVKAEGIDVLRRELGSVRPLANEFDGELQIMARLAKATDDVDILRSEEERNLLRRALLFQGFAVHRYFQDKLGAEAAAAPYRTGEGAGAWVTSWLDACSLLGVSNAIAEDDIPEKSERLAYDKTQAECQSMPSATFVIGQLAAGAEVRIDGVKIEGGAGVRVRATPGRHLFHVSVGDTLLLAGDARIKAGSDAVITAPFGPTELAQLEGMVQTRKGGWVIPAPARLPIQGLGEPAYIAVPGGEKTLLLRVDGDVATEMRLAAPPEALAVNVRTRITLGGGWVSSGDFLLQNLDDGAVADKYTVNAGTPAASVSVAAEGRFWSAGVGLDGQLTVGDHHSLPTGETDTSVFLYPHLAAGLPWVQATVGPLFPWYLGIGGRARIPIVKPVELFASGVYGLPLERPRAEGEPSFTPLPMYSAWGGVTVRIGR